ncbi:pectate lyase superfamily protein-domain-containing protein [Geopyxis carbonaria]|nr:pectate lyase superfamily protein-domain-containing protein [Geopyxis carbonaria]
MLMPRDTNSTDKNSSRIAAAASSFWLENMTHRGRAAYNANPSTYPVFRNVKDYGARGDGVTDDTAAINAAIQAGGRCGQGCDSSTTTPGVIYFPAGTYIVSSPIVAMYYSQLIGDPTNLPRIKGSPNFSGIALIDSDPYLPGGANWYTNQNNFFRAVRNMIIDTTAQPLNAGTGMHWQVAQATSLVNIRFEMSTAAGNLHQGIFMDNGSGGFMSDLTFVGGKIGAFFGNQQFMTRNLKFENCGTAIIINWDWQWTLKSVDINNCGVGVDITSGGAAAQGVGSVILLDSKISNTPVGFLTWKSSSSAPQTGGSAVLDNVQLVNVPKAVANPNGGTILAGGTKTIDLWGQGNKYSASGARTIVQGTLTRSAAKPANLLDSTGKIFERSRPQYTDQPASNFVSVRVEGATGDGTTDDTAAIKRIFATYGGTDRIIYFDHGVYVVTDTIVVPVNTRVVGESWAVIMAAGNNFKDYNNPRPVWKIGNAGDVGRVELQELVFQTKGPVPGAILIQWNSKDPAGQQGANAMWDVHTRVAGSSHTELEPAQCIKNPGSTAVNANCQAAFMLIHIGKTASVYMENVWAWTSDHNLDGPQYDQISVYNARGIYSESTVGPVWMYATASEHNVLYQIQFQNTKNVFVGMFQSETPYFQSNPTAKVPFTSLSAWNDPDYSACTTTSCAKSWALRIINSSNILIYGAGLYSFFENYAQTCIDSQSCQDAITDIRGSSAVNIFNLNTVATANLITYNGQNMATAADNYNSFARTVMQFSI